jgi:hypothetical protein
MTPSPPNPYEAPRAERLESTDQGQVPQSLRGPFLLAAIGAWLASAYWAGLTLLLLLGLAMGSASSSFQVLFPAVLIGLYAFRGYQLIKGNPAAAKRILWLHGFGGAAALLNIVSSTTSLWSTLQGIKIAIHVFGAVTAYLAHRAFSEAQTRRP